jgi:hypothetical protein
MDAILSETGFAFNATEYVSLYGNEQFLRLQRKYTIRTIDRTTKIPQITKNYRLVHGPGYKVIELPRFCMFDLVAPAGTRPSATSPITQVMNRLPTHEQLDHLEYTGQSNPNQLIVVDHVEDRFVQKEVAGYTLQIAAGCHAADTGILMYDGTTKQVQDIELNDVLMGDDSAPRKVLKLVRGTDIMYKITSRSGESYTVNGEHILCLKYMSKRFHNNIHKDLVVELTVREYLRLSKRLQKELKGYKVAVEFPSIDVPIDPYALGYWLGSKTRACNIFDKHIPHLYKCNSRQKRLKLLAGLLDANGHLGFDSSFGFEQSIDHERLFDDVVYLVHSLGFACYTSKQENTLEMTIDGDTYLIPTLHKQVKPYKQTRDILVSGLTIEQLSCGKYYGFQVDGNRRYLGSCFTAFHNCGKTFAAMDLIGRMKLKTLVVVPNTYLLDQWVGLLTQYFPDARIGTLYGKKKQDGDIIVSIINTAADLASFVTTEKHPILTNDGKRVRYDKVQQTVVVNELLAQVGLAIFDECQMYVSKEFRKVFRRIQSRYTIGLSATPNIREDKLDVIHQSWLGPILNAETLDGYNVTSDAFVSDAKLIEYHARHEHCQFSIREDGMIDYASIIESLITDPNRNNLIVDQIIELMMTGLYTFVFSDRRSHLELLYELLEARCTALGLASAIELPEAEKKVILYGGANEETIEKAKTLSTVILTTYAYSSTGVSITKMNALVLSTPRRSNMTQIINRVFRLGSDQTIKRIIIDICDAKMPIKGQIRERVKAYNQRGSTILKSRVDA